MGVDLHGAGGYVLYPWYHWQQFLGMAYLFGWEGPGTLPPDLRDKNNEPIYPPEILEKWDGTYFANNYQRVSEEDAWNIAIALQRALRLNGVLDQEAMERKKSLDAEGCKEWDIHLSKWCGKGREMVEEFITYCLAGEFVIG
jgi:hypothetical protein